MDTEPKGSSVSDKESTWAMPVTRLKVTELPPGASNINVDGHQPVSPMQGFGQLWQKTFRIRLKGVLLSPAEVMDVWKANFQKFQPPENRFYPTLSGIKPGEVLLIEARVPPFPGLPSVLPVATGVLVMYADAVAFTVMTPEGHPVSGWNTFSVSEEDGGLFAQIQTLERSSDFFYEFFNRFLGSSGQQDKIWKHVLVSLSDHLGVKGEQVTYSKVLVDPRVQWSQARNIWNNAAIRTVFHLSLSPFRKIKEAVNSSRKSKATG